MTNGSTDVFLNCEMVVNGTSPAKRIENYDPDLPQCDITEDFCSLMKRQPGYKARGQAEDCGDGYVMWKGKRVKNVKKFKKVI